MDNKGAGKILLDKIRAAIDTDSSTSVSANPSVIRSRLKRQDSVERSLEKSGSFEAVDRAIRAIFGVLLKHSNIYYIT